MHSPLHTRINVQHIFIKCQAPNDKHMWVRKIVIESTLFKWTLWVLLKPGHVLLRTVLFLYIVLFLFHCKEGSVIYSLWALQEACIRVCKLSNLYFLFAAWVCVVACRFGLTEVCRGWSRARWLLVDSFCLLKKREKGMKEQLACLPVQDPSGLKGLPSHHIQMPSNSLSVLLFTPKP